MPQLIKHLDQIAREKNRTVLAIDFFSSKDGSFDAETPCPAKKQVLDWLKRHNISYEKCGHVANDNLLVYPPIDRIYVDVPFKEDDDDFIKLSNYLENADGSMKIEGVWFNYLPLEKALENKHHDEPGYWD